MNAIVADHAYDVECFLYIGRKASRNQFLDVFIDVIPGVTEVCAEFLNCETKQRSCAPRGLVGNFASFFEVRSNVRWQVRIRRFGRKGIWIDYHFPEPNGRMTAAFAIRNAKALVLVI